MKKPMWIVFGFILILSLSAACSRDGKNFTPTIPPETATLDEEIFIGLPNPASFYCQEMGYMLEMEEGEEGTVGICNFPDGSQCEEWDFLNGRCGQEWSYCQRQGYRLESNGETAQCNFPDGSSCPEYEFFTRECQPPGSE